MTRHTSANLQKQKQIALETEFDNAPALALYTSLGFVPEKRLHRFYLNGKDAFRLVLPLAPSSASSSSSDLVPTHDDDDDDDVEDTAKLARLRRRVAALRGCRMVTVWPADDDDRVSGR